MISQQKHQQSIPEKVYQLLKLILQYLNKRTKDYQKVQLSKSLTPKMRFFELFIKKQKPNKKKDSNCWKSVKMRPSRRTLWHAIVVTTGRHGLRRPILHKFFSCCLHYPQQQVWRTVPSSTVCRGSLFHKTWTSWKLCTGSLLWSLQRTSRTDRRGYDGPSWTSVIPH